MTTLLMPALLALVAGALVFEGRTALVCARALAPGGAATLTRLGAGFLLSEVWVIALLGVAHAVRPADWHALLGTGAGAIALYGIGWAVRDAGLWFGPRVAAGRGLCRVLVGAGALVQLAAAAGVVVAVAGLDWQGTPPVGPAVAVLAVAVPGCVLLVASLQAAGWLLLRRDWGTTFFTWTRSTPFAPVATVTG